MADSDQNADYWHMLAATGWLELGDPVEAKNEVEKLSSETQSSQKVREIHCSLHAINENWQDCLDEAARILEDCPDSLGGGLLYARALCALGDPKKALETLVPLAEQYPNEPLVFFGLSWCAFLCQDEPGIEERAIEWIRKGMRLDPQPFVNFLGPEVAEDIRKVCEDIDRWDAELPEEGGDSKE